jgi:crotonobetainyl-CoA:carnitine CoA-transferase CaiB-like acyl-CoA transferase
LATTAALGEPLILDDLLVVDLTCGVAGAYTTKVLADGGATVVRIEPPGGVALRRRVLGGAAIPDGETGPTFAYLDGGKRSVVVDPDTEVGHRDRERLLAAADVIVTDAADGEALHGDHPSAIVVSHTPFGLTGPWVDRPATELTLQAWSGSIGGRGDIDRPPVAAGGALSAWVSGVAGAAVALVAWRGGTGLLVDLAEFEVAVMIYNGFQTVARELTDQPSPVPARITEVPSIEPASDGWVGFCALSAQQFGAFAEMIGKPEWATDPDITRVDFRTRHAGVLRPQIAEWTSTRTVSEILDAARARRIPVAPVGNGDTLPKIVQLQRRATFERNPTGGFLQPRPAARMSRSSLRPSQPAPEIGDHDVDEILGARQQRAARRPAGERPPGEWPLPLAGLRVLDLTSFWAGPVVGQLLGAFGAEVVKVESIQRPDGTRLGTAYGVTGDRVWERAPLFHACNTNKLGVTLDLSRPEGRDIAARLLATCDVLIENYSPRVVEQFGLLDGRRDDLIVVRMPAWGLDGPWRDQPGFAQTMEQASGLAWVTGWPDGPPLVPRGPCDPNGGLHAFIATMLALLERDRSGRGQTVESSLIDAALNITAEQVIELSAHGNLLGRQGNRSPFYAPQGVYAARGHEQWIALSVVDDVGWTTLCEVLERQDWAHDPGLATVEGRRERHDELDEGIAKWCAPRDADAAVDALWAAGVPAGRVVTPRDVAANPQLVARHYFEPVRHPVVGPLSIPRLPARLGDHDAPFHRTPAPTLGQHNRQVLGELLGLGTDELDRLEREQFIGTTPS